MTSREAAKQLHRSYVGKWWTYPNPLCGISQLEVELVCNNLNATDLMNAH